MLVVLLNCNPPRVMLRHVKHWQRDLFVLCVYVWVRELVKRFLRWSTRTALRHKSSNSSTDQNNFSDRVSSCEYAFDDSLDWVKLELTSISNREEVVLSPLMGLYRALTSADECQGFAVNNGMSLTHFPTNNVFSNDNIIPVHTYGVIECSLGPHEPEACGHIYILRYDWAVIFSCCH